VQQFTAELFGNIFSVGRGKAGSDDRDTDLIHSEGPPHIEKRGIVINIKEIFRIEGILTSHHGDAVFLATGDLPLGRRPVGKGSDMIGRFRTDAGEDLEGRGGGAKDRLRRSEGRKQGAKPHTAHLLHALEGDPVFQRLLIHESCPSITVRMHLKTGGRYIG
jgi:hypothetical protein